jgi:PAS domain S-box-containing protein
MSKGIISFLKCSIAIAAFLLLTGLASVQAQRYNLSIYNVSNGMPGNQVNDIIQDNHGRLWIGTMNGIAVFDGINFSGFDKNNPITSNPIKSLFQDSRGNIWIGMIRKGICKYNGSSFEFYNSSNGLLNDNVNAITEDKKGNIWIGTSDGLNKYDGKMFHSYTSLRGLVNNNIFSLLFDSKGILWISTIGGISAFDGKDFHNYTTQQGLLSNISYHVTEDSENKIWVSTYLGISWFDGEKFNNYNSAKGLLTDRIEKIIENTEKKKVFASYGGGVGIIESDTVNYITVEKGLPSNIVKALLQDKEGNYWFGTWNGLCKYKGDRFINYTLEDGLANNNILSVATDSSGLVWFGTLTGGVNYADGNTIFTLGLESGLKSTTIWSIYINAKNEHWFGTTNGPAYLDMRTMKFTHPFSFFDNLVIYSILEDPAGRLMFATDKGIYIKVENGEFKNIGVVDGLSNDKVRVLFQDNGGRIWVGTMKGIFYLENDKAYSFNEKYNIPAAPVTSIIQDSTGRILASTYDFGVYVIGNSVNSNAVSAINKTSGLFNDRILFNFLDRNQILWLGTPTGLDCINWRTYLSSGRIEVNHFDKSNGYLGVETNGATADLSGNIWFASVNGAIKHNIHAGTVRNTIPLVRISNIQLFLENVDWKKKQIPINAQTGLPEEMILAYNNNHISFSFSGIYLTAPEEVRYRYILEGFDETWSPPTSQTIANYSNLESGTYVFKVKASANGRVWSYPVTYTFTIKPPYWKTPFFYFLYLATAAGSIFLFLKLRTRALQKTQIMLRQKVEQRTRELNQKNLELEKLSIVASETDNAVLIFNEKKEIEWANTGFTKMTGYNVSDIIYSRGNHINDFTFSKEAESILEECIDHKRSSVFESQIQCKDGKMIWASNTLTPIFNEAGLLKKIVVIDTDITYRKMMEEKIKASLEEKGLLLREIHHRVKNNLQIIISLFNLQSHYINDQKAFEALKEGQDRIKSMALIHERFYQNDGLSKIDFDDYIRRLVENLYMSFNISPERIEQNIEADKISLDIDTAVPCGLIINELVSNTLKHAFSENEKGFLNITFKKLDGEKLQLTISDNGKGMPDQFDFEEVDSLGMQLINALTSQLDGKMSMITGKGTTFILDFKNAHKN